MKFLLLSIFILYLSAPALGQVAQNGFVANVDARMGRWWDAAVGNRRCAQEATLDEYYEARCGIKVQGRYGYHHPGDGNWGDDSISPEYIQQYTDNVVFQNAALDVYKFNQCQKSFFDSYADNTMVAGPEGGPAMVPIQSLYEEQAWLAFQNIRNKDLLNIQTNPKLKKVQEDNDLLISGAIRRGKDSNDPLPRTLELVQRRMKGAKGTYCASVPLGNRDQVRDFIIRVADTNINEQAFKTQYTQLISTILRAEANQNFNTINDTAIEGKGSEQPIFNIEMHFKRDLLDTGIVDNLIEQNGMDEFAQSEYMCRYRSQRRGENVHAGVQIAVAAAMIAASGGAFTPIVAGALRVGTAIRSSIPLLNGASRVGTAISTGMLNSRAGQLTLAGAKAIGRSITSSTTGKAFYLGWAAYDLTTMVTDINRECHSVEYLTSKASKTCDAPRQTYEILAEANIAGCMMGILGSGAGMIDNAMALNRLYRAVGGSGGSAVDEVHEGIRSRTQDRVFGQPRDRTAPIDPVEPPTTLLVTAPRTPTQFAITPEVSDLTKNELIARGITPGQTELTPDLLNSLSPPLTPTQRAVYFEELTNSALTPEQLAELNEILDGAMDATTRQTRLRSLLDDINNSPPAAELDAITLRVNNSGIFNTAARVVNDAPTTPRRHPLREQLDGEAPSSSSRTPARSQIDEEEFIQSYSVRNQTTTAENEAFIRLAQNPDPVRGLFFLDLQNTRLKDLNGLMSKPLIDALNNKHHELVSEALSRFRARHPNIEISMQPYSDYKGFRVAITGADGRAARLIEELRPFIDQAESQFDAFIRSSGFTGMTDEVLSKPWFGIGIARTYDEANVLSRFPADMTWTLINNTRLRLNTFRQNFIEQRAGIQALSSPIPGSNARTFTPEVFELLRKNPDNPAYIAQTLNQRYQLSPPLSLPEVGEMQRYFQDVNLFSPGLLIAQRVNHNIEGAVHGGITLDFRGVGSFNARATAEGLSRGITVQDSIRRTRRLEIEYTTQLNQIKENAQTAINTVLGRHGITAEVTTSGDDMVVVPTRALSRQVRDEIVLEQARMNIPSSMRISFFPPGVARTDVRALIAVEGEEFEKTLRIRLGSILTPDELRNLIIATDMRGRVVGNGPVRLITNQSLPPQRMQLVNSEFRQIVGDRAVLTPRISAANRAAVQTTSRNLGRSPRIKYRIHGQEVAIDATTLTPGQSYTVIIHDNKLIIGEDYLGESLTTRGSHLTMVKELDPRATWESFDGSAGTIRINNNGSIDISGYHNKHADIESAQDIDEIIQEAFPSARTRTTPDRITALD